jgi:hypothetical protein
MYTHVHPHMYTPTRSDNTAAGAHISSNSARLRVVRTCARTSARTHQRRGASLAEHARGVGDHAERVAAAAGDHEHWQAAQGWNGARLQAVRAGPPQVAAADGGGAEAQLVVLVPPPRVRLHGAGLERAVGSRLRAAIRVGKEEEEDRN